MEFFGSERINVGQIDVEARVGVMVVAMGGCYVWLLWVVAMGGCYVWLLCVVAMCGGPK